MISGVFYDTVHEARRSAAELGALGVWCVKNCTTAQRGIFCNPSRVTSTGPDTRVEKQGCCSWMFDLQHQKKAR